MKTTVKKWAFNLVLLSLMASCGGDNNTTDVSNEVDGIFNSNSSSSAGTTRAQGFIDAFDKNGFAGGGQGSDYTYRSSSYSSSDCEEKWGWFTYCSSSSSGSSNFGIREVRSNGEIFRNSFMENHDDFGRSLNEVKETLLQRMKSARNSDGAYKCLQYSGYPEYCYTYQKWTEIYYQCRQEIESGYYSNGCQSIVASDPRTQTSRRYLFEGNSGVLFLVDLSKPLGAQPVSFSTSDGRLVNYSN